VLFQARAGGKKKSQRTVSLLSELPGWKVDADGHKAGPLEEYLDGVKPKRTRKSRRDASQLSQYAFAEMMQRPSQAPLLLLM
jgi:hypothetical protein